MSAIETDGVLMVGDEVTQLGARKTEPCDCGQSDCFRLGKGIEVAVLVDTDLAQQSLESAASCCDEDHPVVFPVFLDAADARALAAKLLQLADEADPHAKN